MITIRELRARHNLSQVQLSKETGITEGSVVRLEKDITVTSVQNIITLAEYFNVSADDLLGIKISK